MKFQITITLLLSILIVPTVYSQNSKLPSGIGFHTKAPTKDALSKKTELLKSIDYVSLDSLDKWTYYLAKSSVLLYGNQDSSVHYFEMAHQYAARRNCKVIKMLQKSSEESNEQWFLTELPNFDEEKFIANCQIKVSLLGKDDRKKNGSGKIDYDK